MRILDNIIRFIVGGLFISNLLAKKNTDGWGAMQYPQLVLGMLAIFTYGFKVAEDNFANANCELTTLGDYEGLINKASEKGIVSAELKDTLQEWRQSPETWMSID